MERQFVLSTVAGLTVGIAGASQAQFFTDFDTDEGFTVPFVDEVDFSVNTAVGNGFTEHFVGGGGTFDSSVPNPGDFNNRLPTLATYNVSGGIASLGIDGSNHADVSDGGFSFWFSGINTPVTVAGASSAADVSVTASVLGTGANGDSAGQADIRLFVSQDAVTGLEYTFDFDPNSATVFTTIGGNLATDFSNNDDPFAPLDPFDFSQPFQIQLQFGSETNGWGRDADNLIQADWVRVVPEPGSLALLSLGGLVTLARRRK